MRPIRFRTEDLCRLLPRAGRNRVGSDHVAPFAFDGTERADQEQKSSSSGTILFDVHAGPPGDIQPLRSLGAWDRRVGSHAKLRNQIQEAHAIAAAEPSPRMLAKDVRSKGCFDAIPVHNGRSLGPSRAVSFAGRSLCQPSLAQSSKS